MKCSAMPDCDHPRVVLRPITPEDIQIWYDYLSRPEVFAHTSWSVASPDELAHYAWRPETFTESSLLRFAVRSRDTDVLVGTAGFHTVAPQHRSAEIAYDLAPAVWGQGIATSVCGALVRWAHEHAGITRVQATVLESNQRSMKVLDRCGFEREGLLRSYRMVRGHPGDFWMYAHVRGVRAIP
jgi:ribosomal-protein-alanine N-acetyltransferase